MEQVRQNEKTVFVIKILLIAVALFLFVFFIAKLYLMRTIVDGSSMYPTLENGEHVLVEKHAYANKEPERFDIVVFATPISTTGNFVKRIVGLPGETVQIDNYGNIYINGELIEENYGAEKLTDPGRARKGVTLGEDEYFVMGDNRNHSEDSRFMLVGNIKKDRFLGKVTLRIWPIDKYGYIDLYMDRTRECK